MIRFTHPKHGATHAYSAEEAADLRKRGWTAEAEIAALFKPPVAPEPQQEPKPEPQPEKRNPGRPHKAV
jgi:hypothetical protein